MLNGKSSPRAHAAQNAFLILLSLAFLPLDTFILALSHAVGTLRGRCRIAGVRKCRDPKTILVTGVGMTKGLALARSFHIAGHRVIGADFETGWALVPGRFSVAIEKFYRLQKPTAKTSAPYVQGLLDVILREKVDLWVSCSGVASAVEDGEAKEIVESRTSCRAIQFDVATTQMLHEKHTFIENTAYIGLNVPETHTITDRGMVDDALEKAPAGRKYIMKTIGMDDAARGDIMTLLPKDSEKETSEYLDRLRISKDAPWILQQYVEGEEFCTHALVVKGQVKAFVACPSSDLLMHYMALPAESALSKAMLEFTKTYASHGGESFTGHLSFDFFVEDTAQTDPQKIVLYPIECNPRAHTAVCLFNGTPNMVEGYLDLLDDNMVNGVSESSIVSPAHENKNYWTGHDLVSRAVIPLLNFLTRKVSMDETTQKLRECLVHFLAWKDGTFELWDPLPWFVLYHVYWPIQFLMCLWSGKKWSRINVSTLKMFEC